LRSELTGMAQQIINGDNFNTAQHALPVRLTGRFGYDTRIELLFLQFSTQPRLLFGSGRFGRCSYDPAYMSLLYKSV
jgi:hypothetical protein